MQSLKTAVLLGSMVLATGLVSSAASAAGFSPPGPFSSANGSLVFKSPASFQAAVTCGLSFSGTIDANGVATISSVVLATNSLCSLFKPTGLPWTVNLSSTSQGALNNFGFTMKKLVGPDSSICGPGSVAVSWDNAAHVLSSANQALSGSCTLVSLNATLTGSIITGP